MVNRMATVWFVVGVLAGYLIAGSSATAQSSPALAPSAVAIGAELTLQFERGTLSENVSSMRCSVVTVEGHWVKCALSDGFATDQNQKWVNLAYVTQMTRREK
jgi:hypothetical protein